jgi:hypothetical protein
MKPYYSNLNLQLKTLDARIVEIKKIINKSDIKSEGSILPFSFLLNELYKVQAQKDTILEILSGETSNGIYLVGEVYSVGEQSGKNLRTLLFEGLIAGILIGLITILMNLAIRKIKF